MKIFILLMLIFTASSSRGNDSIANVETGNITFKKSKEIIMESEELSISPSKITVKYSFRNETKKPIAEAVVFPLPPSHSASGGWDAPEPSDPKNTINFVLKVDGKSKPFKIHSNKVDIDKENDIHLIESFYSWQQTFPNGKNLIVEHEYDTNPGSGGGLEFDEETKRKYCMDRSFLEGFEKIKLKIKKIAAKSDREDYQNSLGLYLHYNSFSHVSYILTTGNNWSGPIRKFKLKIKKDKPSTLVTFCWDGLKKVSDLEFESFKENFSPTTNLNILFVHER